jgi:hypothetical protein
MQSNLKIPANIQHILNAPIWIFGISFAIGTALMLLYLLDKTFDSILLFCFVYVLLAFLANMIAFGILVGLSFVHRQYQKQILQHTAILFLNIPVAIGYIYLVFNSI